MKAKIEPINNSFLMSLADKDLDTFLSRFLSV